MAGKNKNILEFIYIKLKPYRHLTQYIPFVFLLFFVFSFLYKSDFSFNQDLGLHLKLGQIIFTTGIVPKINLFSYTNPSFTFVNHHWLFEVFAYVSSISVGLQALLILKILIILFCAAVILMLSKRTKSAFFVPGAFIFFHLLRERTDFRPEIFSFLFTVLTIYILEDFERKNSKLIYFLPIVMLVWTNTHIYFPVGIFIIFVFWADLLFRKFYLKQPEVLDKLKKLSIVAGASVLVTLINPNFITGALYPFTVFNNYGVTITENQTIFTLQNIHFVSPDFLFFYISAIIVIASIYISFFRKGFSIKNTLLCLLGLGLAFQSIRGFPYLVLISLPYVLLNFNYTVSNIWIKAVNVIVVILIVFEAYFYLSGIYYGLTYEPYLPTLNLVQDEKQATDFVLEHNLPQPIFNNFDTGSYFIYRSFPKYRVFVDERPEAYPASFFTNVYNPMQENYSDFKKVEKRYGFKTIFFTITDQNPRALKFLNAVTKDPSWKIVYLDQYMMVMVKSNLQKSMNLKTVDLTKLKISDFKYSKVTAYTNLSTFLFNLHYYKEAKIFNEKALAINPGNPAANKAMAYILFALDPSDSRITGYLSKSQNWVFW